MKELTTKQKEVFDYIKGYSKQFDYQPTIREMATHFKVSTTAITCRIKGLVQKNYIEVMGNRAIRILK